MNRRQAQALLALIADLYILASEPDPEPPPAPNGVTVEKPQKARAS